MAGVVVRASSLTGAPPAVRLPGSRGIVPDVWVAPPRLRWQPKRRGPSRHGLPVPAYGVTDHGGMGDLVTTLVGGVAVLVLTGLAIYSYQRSLDKPGGREGLGQVGDVFGGLIDVLEPGHGRAREALRDIENAGPVTPTPEDDADDPIRLLTHPDGPPRSIRIRRPR